MEHTQLRSLLKLILRIYSIFRLDPKIMLPRSTTLSSVVPRMFWYLLLIFPLGVIVDQYIFKIFPPKTEQNLFTMKSGEKQN